MGGHLEVVKALLEIGADVKGKNTNVNNKRAFAHSPSRSLTYV
jgi:ankyrin repeat protein